MSHSFPVLQSALGPDGAPTVADLVRQRPRAAAILRAHRIDFCCGGHRALDAACAARGLAVDALLREVDAEEARWGAAPTRWDEQPVPALVEHLLTRYHAPLYPELDRLLELAAKVARTHGERDARLPAVEGALQALAMELRDHMAKEERVLFPAILRGHAPALAGPVACMRHEHEEAGALLAHLSALTDAHTPPEGACGSWRALLVGLAFLEQDLHEHIALENNVLFVRIGHAPASDA